MLKLQCNLVFIELQTSKLVLDEYFSGEPLQDIAQFYSSFDSLPQPIIASNDVVPLSPPESIPSPGVFNGQSEDNLTSNACVIVINI